MRLITYYDNKGTINPIVINKSGLLYRLDILRPNTITLTLLQSGKAYTGNEVITSIIYDGFAVTRFVSGPIAIVEKFIKELPKPVLRDFIYDLILQEDQFFSDGSKLGIFGSNRSSGTSSKLKFTNYDKRCMRMIEGDNDFYTNKEIKNMQYFIDTKHIDPSLKNYKCLYSIPAIQEYVNSRDWCTRVGSVDTETNDLTFFYNHEKNGNMVGLSHSYEKDQGVYIQFRYKGDQLLDYTEVLEIMKPILLAKNIYQNGSFDYRVLRRHGLNVPIYRELTSILQLTNPDPYKKKALKTVANQLLGEETIELDEILGKDFDARMVEFIDRDLITYYACGDTDKTLTIANMLYEKLPSNTRTLLDEDMPAYQEVCIADWYGFPADYDKLQKVYTGVMQDKANMENYILDYIYIIAPPIQAKRMLLKLGVTLDKITEEVITSVMSSEEFNRILKRKLIGVRQPRLELDYDGDKQKIFYDLLEYPRIRLTKAGALSVGKEYFEDLCKYESKTPSSIAKQDLLTVLEDVDQHGEKVKLLNKDSINKLAFPLGYMFKEYAIVCNKVKIYKRLLTNYSNGRTFEPYRYNATATGRLSSAIHTIAGYAKGIIGHKPDSDKAMLIFDADQIELRGVHNEAIRMWDNMMSQPEIMNDLDNPLWRYNYNPIVDIFNNVESDPHTEMAAQFNHVTLRQVTPIMRKRGKAVNFSGTYGAHSRTMAKVELSMARTDVERQAILRSYASTKEAWQSTNMHLRNYFDTTKMEALQHIPAEEIPFNAEGTHVGRTTTRSGRRRYYELDNADSYTISRIQNRGRNQYIQSYCRDIIFIAIRNLTKALRDAGFTDEDIRGLLYVHDEEGLEYTKSKFNPLWLLAMVYRYCCIEVEGHKIKYYVTPAIVNNWYEGKSDYYEVPKKMMAKLSLNIEDYEQLPDDNHRDYVVSKIEEYYHGEMFDIFKSKIDLDIVEASNIDVTTRYNFFKRAGLHTKSLKKQLFVPELDILFNHAANHPDAKDYQHINILFNGNSFTLKDFISETVAEEFSIEEFDLGGFETFDSSEEFEAANSLLSFDEAVRTVINYKTIEELDKEYVNITREFSDDIMDNIYWERYFNRVTISIGKTSKGMLDSNAVKSINKILQEVMSSNGIQIFYFVDQKKIDSGIKVPENFNFKKFDSYINRLRKEI